MGAREQADEQFKRFYPLFRRFYLNALSLIAVCEKQIKTIILNQLVSINKQLKHDVSYVYALKV
jgi:hypothetical protein